MGEQQRVYPPHHAEVAIVRRRLRPLDARARKGKQSALPANRQRRVVTVEHRFSRSGLLMVRTSWLKNRVPPSVGRSWHAASRSNAPAAPRQSGRRRGRTPAPPVPEAAFSTHKLVRVDLVTLREIPHRRLLAQCLQGDLRLQRRVDPPSRLSRPGPAPSLTTEPDRLQSSR